MNWGGIDASTDLLFWDVSVDQWLWVFRVYEGASLAIWAYAISTIFIRSCLFQIWK